MNQQAVEEYIAKLPYSEVFTDLPVEVRNRIVFGSHEMLKRRYDESLITDDVIGLQALFVAEGEEEEFAKFKRQGVTNIGLSGLSVAVKGSNVSPEVIALLGDPITDTVSETAAFFGRLF